MYWKEHERSCLQLSEADAPVADPCAGDVIMFVGGTLMFAGGTATFRLR